MPPDSNLTPEQLRELIAIHRKRLYFLEQRRARYGINTPPEVLMEIDEIQGEIEALQRQLHALQGRPSGPDPRPPAVVPPAEPQAPPAAELPDDSAHHALLIGVGAYAHLSLLSRTTADAADLHELLHENGYRQSNVALLLDAAATKANISEHLDWMAGRVQPGDTALIFFSGHGIQRIGGFEPGEYLCPVGARTGELRASAISDKELTLALRALKAAYLAVFLDACHAGGVGQPAREASGTRAGLSESGYARLAAGRGKVIIGSCEPGEVSWELANMRNGLFTHYLLRGLRGEAAGPDGVVRILGLFEYLSQQVPRHKPQHPLFKGEIRDNFPIIGAR
jgi:hypothetical protein